MSYFSAYNYTGKIGQATDLSEVPFDERESGDDSIEYFLDLLGCDIQEAKGERTQSGISNYSYVVYIPMNDEDGEGLVRYNEQDMTMEEYLQLSNKITITEGQYFVGNIHGKEVKGRITFYLPNQIGCKFGVLDPDAE